MNPALHFINRKIDDIQVGLLRFNNKGRQRTMEVRATVGGSDLLNCLVISDNSGTRLLNRKVSLIQKNHYDYLYIAGRISGEVQKTSTIISLQITKVCWFTRKRKGGEIWLQEKYIYENLKQPMAS